MKQLARDLCVHNKMHEPVLCGGALEAFVTCYERDNVGRGYSCWSPDRKKVAIGWRRSSGLSVAEQLVQKGHEITIFDSKHIPWWIAALWHPQF
jgi:NADPH-dependent glutamate synthase beta subunit-like oxidoreductase